MEQVLCLLVVALAVFTAGCLVAVFCMAIAMLVEIGRMLDRLGDK